MPPSRLDAIYRRLLMTKFFTKGWGQPENLQRLFEFRKIISNRERCYKLIPKDYPVEITKEETTSDCRILEGKFVTPLEVFLPGLVPKIAQDAHFQIILPLKWENEDYKPVCIHLAGTGDHFYWRRRNFVAKPLLRESGIGAIILENPFYGVRKPKDQVRSCLHNVSDIFVMGGCLILESMVLLHWCERMKLGPLGLTGLSMGGHMASLAATNWPKPIVLVPCLSWSTASSVFTEGVMSKSIDWNRLEEQFLADGNYCDRLAKMVTVVDDSFLAGRKFIKQFNQSIKELKSDINEVKHQYNNSITKEIVPMSDSECLYQQLISKDAAEFTQNEINSINEKIKIILMRRKQAEEIKQLEKIDIKERHETTMEVAANVITSATNGITSVIFAGKTKLMGLILPSPKTEEENPKTIQENNAKTNSENIENSEKIDISKTNWWEREALQFMRGVMDECTHLKNFSVPCDTSLTIVVCAKDDAYIPREGCSSLDDLWPGAEIRYVDAGHVSAYVLHQKFFRSCIREAFEKSKEKWIPYHKQCLDNNTHVIYFKPNDKKMQT